MESFFAIREKTGRALNTEFKRRKEILHFTTKATKNTKKKKKKKKVLNTEFIEVNTEFHRV